MSSKPRKSTIKDVQAATGLSLSTISKYMNGGNVRPHNKVILDEAIKQLNYRADPFAQGLKSKRSHTIGILVPEFTSTFNMTLVAYLEELLLKKDYSVLIYTCNKSVTNEKKCVELMLEKHVDGIISIPYDNTGKVFEQAIAEKVPVVLLDRYINEQYDTIVINNRQAIKQAMEHFYQHGHKRIGLITGNHNLYTMRERYYGYTDSLSSHNISLEPDIISIGGLNITDGKNGMLKLLSAKEPVTCVLCTSYELVLGAIMTINQQNLKIGTDISVIGFDNLELAQVINPQLTILMQPLREMTISAISLLLERLENPKDTPAKIQMLNAELVIGNSVTHISK